MKYKLLAVMIAAFLMLSFTGLTASATEIVIDEAEPTPTPNTEVVTVSAVEEQEHTVNPFTPSGTGTVMDSATDTDGKQFYTITTPSENIFYLIIDLERDTDNVYFLNAVTERDLMALAEIFENTGESVSAVPSNVGTVPPESTSTPEPESSPESEPESEPKPEQSISPVTMIIAVAVVLIAGGAGYYLKVYRPKQRSASEDEYEPEVEETEEDNTWDDSADDYNDNPPWDDDDSSEDDDV